MFALKYIVKINGREFKGVNDVEIKRSITTLGATATIKLPATALLNKTDGSRLNVLTTQQVKRGDLVEIELGYNSKLNKEFSGYVTRVNLTQPLEVECEDAVYKLRIVDMAKSYKNTTLTKVLSDIVARTGITVSTGGLEIKIDKLLLATETGGKVTREIAMQHILDRYGLVGYFDTAQNLFVGLRQGKRLKTVKLRLNWNTIKDDELKYHNSDEMKVQIKAVYINKLGVRTEVEVGDKDGATRTVFLTDVADKSQMQKLAQNELEKYKFDGYAGKITCFLQPHCEPGDIVSITDEKYSKRAGNYYCEGIEVSFGTNGARRKIEIGAKVSS